MNGRVTEYIRQKEYEFLDLKKRNIQDKAIGLTRGGHAADLPQMAVGESESDLLFSAISPAGCGEQRFSVPHFPGICT